MLISYDTIKPYLISNNILAKGIHSYVYNYGEDLIIRSTSLHYYSLLQIDFYIKTNYFNIGCPLLGISYYGGNLFLIFKRMKRVNHEIAFNIEFFDNFKVNNMVTRLFKI